MSMPKYLYAAYILFDKSHSKLGELFYGYSRNLLAIDGWCTNWSKMVLFGRKNVAVMAERIGFGKGCNLA